MGVYGYLRWANNHVGIKESGGYNHTIFWEWYRRIYGPNDEGYSWCGAAACVSLTYGAGWKPPADWISVWAIETWGRNNGRYHSGVTGIKPGDILILLAHGQHTGIARSEPKFGVVKTYEGNTSSGLVGSQYNGDGYYARSRPYYQVVGYVRIHDLLDQHHSPSPPPDFNLRSLPLSRDGAKGPQTVGHIQKVIGDIEDGKWCPETTKKLKRHLNKVLGLKGKQALNVNDGHLTMRCIRRLQQHVGVRQTGVWSRRTTLAVQEKLNRRKF